MAPATANQQLVGKLPEPLQGDSEDTVGKVAGAILGLPESIARLLLKLSPDALKAALRGLPGGPAIVRLPMLYLCWCC